MVGLLEIEAAAKSLSLEEREALVLFLAETLRNERGVKMPEPRRFTKEQVAGWIAEDEADMKSLRQAVAASGNIRLSTGVPRPGLV